MEEILTTLGLVELDEYKGIELWKRPSYLRHDVDALIPPEAQQDVSNLARSMEADVDVLIGDLKELLDQEGVAQEREYVSSRAYSLTWRKYHRLSDIFEFLDVLSNEYPDKVKVETIGHTHENRDLRIVKLMTDTEEEGKKPVVWIDAGIHAREWITPAVATYVIHELVENEKNADLLDKFEYHILPIANPDGYEFTHANPLNRLWRKNRSQQGFFSAICRGVDPNRNFDAGFGNSGQYASSSHSRCSGTFRGSKAFSEAETRAIKDHLEGISDRVKMYMSLHSYSQYLLLPYGFKEERPRDLSQLDFMAKEGIKDLESVYGTKYLVGNVIDLLYPASGTSMDWAKDKLGVKHSYTFELRDTGRYGFLLPTEQIEPTSKETFEGLKRMFELLDEEVNLGRSIYPEHLSLSRADVKVSDPDRRYPPPIYEPELSRSDLKELLTEAGSLSGDVSSPAYQGDGLVKSHVEVPVVVEELHPMETFLEDKENVIVDPLKADYNIHSNINVDVAPEVPDSTISGSEENVDVLRTDLEAQAKSSPKDDASEFTEEQLSGRNSEDDEERIYDLSVVINKRISEIESALQQESTESEPGSLEFSASVEVANSEDALELEQRSTEDSVQTSSDSEEDSLEFSTSVEVTDSEDTSDFEQRSTEDSSEMSSDSEETLLEFSASVEASDSEEPVLYSQGPESEVAQVEGNEKTTDPRPLESTIVPVAEQIESEKQTAEEKTGSEKQSIEEKTESKKQSMEKKTESEKQSMEEKTESEKQSMEEKTESEEQTIEGKTGSEKQSLEEKTESEKQSMDEKTESENQSMEEKIESEKQTTEGKTGSEEPTTEVKNGSEKQTIEEETESEKQSMDEKTESEKQSRSRMVQYFLTLSVCSFLISTVWPAPLTDTALRQPRVCKTTDTDTSVREARGEECKVTYNGYQIWRITPESPEDAPLLLRLDDFEGADVLKTPRDEERFVDVLVPPEKISDVEGFAKVLRAHIEILTSDLAQVLEREEREIRKALATRTDGEIKLDMYNRVQEMYEFLNSLAENYPDKVRVDIIGQSSEGRNMMLIRISNNIAESDEKPIVFFEAGCHAREWATSASTLFMINEFVQKEGNSEFLDNFQLYFVPMCNPDGYEYTHTNQRMWRKTRSGDKRSRCIGVDPNRNWDAGFGLPGASGNQCSSIYRGPSAFSEPETKAISDYLLERKEKVKMYISIHSYSQLLLLPYGYKSVRPENYNSMKEFGQEAINKLSAVYGTKYKVGGVQDLLYAASGSSMDWALDKLDVLYAFTFELRDTGHHGFSLPANQIIPTAEETFAAVKQMLTGLHQELSGVTRAGSQTNPEEKIIENEAALKIPLEEPITTDTQGRKNFLKYEDEVDLVKESEVAGSNEDQVGSQSKETKNEEKVVENRPIIKLNPAGDAEEGSILSSSEFSIGTELNFSGLSAASSDEPPKESEPTKQTEASSTESQGSLEKYKSDTMSPEPVEKPQAVFAVDPRNFDVKIAPHVQRPSEVREGNPNMEQLDVTDELFSIGTGDILLKLEEFKGIELWKRPSIQRHDVHALIPPAAKKHVAKLAKSIDADVDVLIWDLKELLEKEYIERGRTFPSPKRAYSLTWQKYHRLSDIFEFLNVLSKQYPGKVTVKTIGRTFEHRDIRIVELTAGIQKKGSKPVVWIDAGIHAREWIAPAVATYVIHELVENEKNSELLKHFEYHILPVANPDGITFPGTSAFSEAETKAIKDHLEKIKDRLKMYISLHSYSQYLLTPYGFKSEHPGDWRHLEFMAKEAVRELEALYGTEYEVGCFNHLLYYASGLGMDWAKDKLGVKHSYTIELRDTGHYGFLLPATQIEETSKEAFAGLKRMFRLLHDETSWESCKTWKEHNLSQENYPMTAKDYEWGDFQLIYPRLYGFVVFGIIFIVGLIIILTFLAAILGAFFIVRRKKLPSKQLPPVHPGAGGMDFQRPPPLRAGYDNPVDCTSCGLTPFKSVKRDGNVLVYESPPKIVTPPVGPQIYDPRQPIPMSGPFEEASPGRSGSATSSSGSYESASTHSPVLSFNLPVRTLAREMRKALIEQKKRKGRTKRRKRTPENRMQLIDLD
ncbi:unnamed protein product [Cyprideis torosa]|uniref:Peptidase M14 domain-containing protein n=1 Tax=Cyprideis torosa TaxID=163714 RepID=A0A7R8WAY9_9CRUS|nr:unnamed protein product [Cyprideis torosa]CAG0885786.1 unnamed protein product [Cyprideis torosa]